LIQYYLCNIDEDAEMNGSA